MHPQDALLALANQTKPYKKALGLGLPANQSAAGDPSLENYLLQSALADEAEQNAMMAGRSGAAPQEVKGLLDFFGASKRNMAESPITRQRGLTDAFMDAEQQAIREGYGSQSPIIRDAQPSAASTPGGLPSYAVGDASNVPEGPYDFPEPLDTAVEEPTPSNVWTSRGPSPLANKRASLSEEERYGANVGERTAEAQGKWLMRRDQVAAGSQAAQSENFLRQLQEMRNQGLGSDIAGVRLPTRTGGGGATFDTTPTPNVSTGAARELGIAMQQLGAQTTEQNRAAVQARIDVLRSNIVGNYPTDPVIKQFVQDAINHPDAADASIEDIINSALAIKPDLSQQYISQMRDLLSQLGRK